LQRFTSTVAQCTGIVITFINLNQTNMRLRSLQLTLLMIFTSLLTLVSCQKEFNPGDDDQKKLSSKDPVALSKAIKVWHGVRTQGAPPAPRGTDLQLDNSTSEPLKAFAGRYAIIKPEILTGDVQGYYVALNGANEYFKVDYTKPRDLPGRQAGSIHRRNKPFQAADASRQQRNGNVDSSIVVVLPASIQVPDTFCVTYWAYDSVGNISNPVTTCIIVNNLGTDANGGWLIGNWKITSTWDSYGRDTVIYNKWIVSDDMVYYCHLDSSTGSTYLAPVNNGTPALGADSIFYRKLDLTIGVNGGQKYEDDESEKDLDYMNSTCSNILFYPTSNYTDIITGAWSFNSATNKVTLIFEFDDMGVPIVEAWEYDVIKLNNNHFIMIDNTYPADPFYIRWQK
jgi:hypothetical protein